MYNRFKFLTIVIAMMSLVLVILAVNIKDNKHRIEYVMSHIEETEPNSKSYVEAKKRYLEAELNLINKRKEGFKMDKGIQSLPEEEK